MLHTHWDREWYESAATYRVRLTQVLGDILTRLENGDLPAFTLDGQTALIDDYCTVYPESYGRIAALVQAGKLHVGPWFTAPDSWLVCGESVLRNLHWGMQQASNMGEKSFTGYLPDTFGHPGGMPALLHHMGLNTAMVWRGVAKAQPMPFTWRGADADASVLTYHLREGYFHPFLHDLALTEDDKAEQLHALVKKLSGDKHPPLLPIGGDHLGAIPPAGFALLKKIVPDSSIVSPVGYMATVASNAQGASLPTVAGDLMDNADAYLLTGVWSARPELKQANRRCQHQLIHQLEPLLVWARQQNIAPEVWPQWHRLWQSAWRALLLNHPHDSICGCSTDGVHRQNQARFEDVTDIVAALITRIERAALAAIALPVETVGDTETLEEPGDIPAALMVVNPTGAALPGTVLPIIATGAKAIERVAGSTAIQWAEQHTVLADGYQTDPNQIPLSHLTVPQRRGWLWVNDDSPSLVRRMEVAQLQACPQPVQAATVAQAVRLVGSQVSCHVTPNESGVRVSSPYGGWTVRFTWQPDVGDSYNRCPVPGVAPMAAVCQSVSLQHHGPLVASCQSVWHWPEKPEAGDFTVTCQLIAGSPIVAITADWPTPLPNGLWQCQVDTHRPITQLAAEGHVGVAHTTVDPAYDWRDTLPVEPFKEALPQSVAMQRFAMANGCVVLSDGPPEVEAVGSTMNVSLLRTFGQISNGAMATRGGAAGPPVTTPQAQHTNQPVAVCVGVGSVPQPLLGQQAWVPWAMEQATHFGGAAWAIVRQPETNTWPCPPVKPSATKPIATWANPAIVQVACKPAEDAEGWLLRVVNTSNQPQKAQVRCGQVLGKVWGSNGREDKTEPLTLDSPETFTLSLRPYQLFAIRFDWSPESALPKKLRIKA